MNAMLPDTAAGLSTSPITIPVMELSRAHAGEPHAKSAAQKAAVPRGPFNGRLLLSRLVKHGRTENRPDTNN